MSGTKDKLNRQDLQGDTLCLRPVTSKMASSNQPYGEYKSFPKQDAANTEKRPLIFFLLHRTENAPYKGIKVLVMANGNRCPSFFLVSLRRKGT